MTSALAENAELPKISIVINTDGRAESLAETLKSFEYLEYDSFEVCVVCGPTPDRTKDVLRAWGGRIKVASCPERNISISRNIGIAMADGDIVAFIDDDAIPEPEWLRDLAESYQDQRVAASGGFVYNHTGVEFQWKFGTVDRLGRADLSWDRPATELNFPYTTNFPHLLGANSSFRRDVIVSVGGFDEEYEYFLDETDVICRVVDAGWAVAQLDKAYVHHKYRPSHIRNESKIVKHWYPIIKNKIYFSILNARGHHSIQDAVEEAARFVANFRNEVNWAISVERLTEDDRTRFFEEAEKAWRDGLERGLAGRRRLMTKETLDAFRSPFLPFVSAAPAGGRRTYCFLTQSYPPQAVGGVGRYVHQLARSVAAFGHHVHVLTQGEGHDRVDFEEGVWVHRLLASPDAVPAAPAEPSVPQHIWAHSATMARAVDAIAAKRPVTAVCAPIWDCEPVALVLDRRVPICCSLHTMLRSWLDSHPERAADTKFMREFGTPMLALERFVLTHSDRIVANSAAIVAQTQDAYGLKLEPDLLSLVPHGLEDWTALPADDPPVLPQGMLRLLFVGRLEARKGIDVLLQVIRSLLTRHPHLHFDVVGNDTLPGPQGVTWRAAFEADPGTETIRSRVVFHGEVDDARLRGFYRGCDIFVAPSRFESFGLMLLEGMMFAKPVVACRAGGMVEVIEEGASGLLAEPGDAASLEACVERLVLDADLRRRLAAGARARYEARFTAARMASGVIECLDRAARDFSGRRLASGPGWRQAGGAA
ncbi:glycosyltransferase [Inquilinus limosus]|uniref:glycosyltransferase n=1 Tax=Inquilinus limosus TaxID=171674 RepID=UPI0006921AD5|nr:glycosyltransferase [Inquilinus limosus]